MSGAEVCGLDDPRKEDYDDRTWAAIRYAREWTETSGEVRDEAVLSDFEKHFDSKKRKHVIGTIRSMTYFNKLNNTFAAPLDRGKAFGRISGNG